MNMNWKGLQSSANLGDAWDTSHRQQLIVLVKSSFFFRGSSLCFRP